MPRTPFVTCSPGRPEVSRNHDRRSRPTVPRTILVSVSRAASPIVSTRFDSRHSLARTERPLGFQPNVLEGSQLGASSNATPPQGLHAGAVTGRCFDPDLPV